MTSPDRPSGGDRVDVQVHRLRDATAGLAEARTVAEVAEVVVDGMLPMLGAIAGGLALLAPDGSRLDAVRQAGDLPPEVFAGYTEFRLDDPANPVTAAFRGGRSVWLGSDTDWSAGFAGGADLHRHASGALCVPLVLGDRVTGVLGYVFDGSLPDEADRRFAEAFGLQVAQALERARLLDVEQAARRRAERLVSLARALAAADSDREAATTLVIELRAEFGADWATVSRLDPAATRAILIAASGPATDPPVRPVRQMPLTGEALRTGRVAAVGSHAEYVARFPQQQPEDGSPAAEAVVVVPMRLADRSVGIVRLAWSAERALTRGERLLLGAAAPIGAQALERTRLAEQERAALTASRLLTDELAASRARLEHLVRSSPAVTYSLDAAPPYRLTFVTENVAAVYGVSAAELLAEPEVFTARLHPADLPAVTANLGTLTEHGHSVIEYRFRRADGSWAWTRDEQVMVYGTDGRPVEVVGSLLDITDRMLTEQRTGRMQELSAALAAAVTPAQVSAAALAPATAVLDGQAAALFLADPADSADPVDPRDPADPGGPVDRVADPADRPAGVPATMTVAGSVGYPEDLVEPWRRVPVTDRTPVGRAVLTGRPQYVRSEAEAAAEFPSMLAVRDPAHTQRSWAAVPLRVGGEVIGAFGVGFSEPRDFPPEERGFLETIAAQCALALERARLYETAATERERLEAVLARLPVGVVIAAAPDGRLVQGNDQVERIWRHPFLPAEGIEGYAGYRGRHPGDGRPVLARDWPLARSLLTGEEIADEEFDIERGDGTRGTILVNSAPIREPDGSIGGAVCTFLDVTERSEARRRLAAAYAAEQAARAGSEAARVRLDRLQTVTAGLSEAASTEQVGSAVVAGMTAVLGCDVAWLGVLDDAGRALVALAASAPLDPLGPAVRVPLDADLPSAEVMRTGQPVWISSTEEGTRRYPELAGARGDHRGPLCLAPLRSRSGPIGVIVLSFAEPRELGPEERGLVSTVADQGALALERARLHEREHAIALTLQHSMLPSALPTVPGLELAARYHPAVQSLEVGGDWYDVLALPDGRVAITVGDVVGRGLGAAAAMGQLRSALAALALSADGPGEVLDGLERFARRLEGARLATVVYAVLDPVSGVLAYACAGHLPPLLVEPDGTARYLDGGRSPLLCGLPPGAGPRPYATTRLPPGGTLLLFTDGLVERRGESLDVGLGRLATAVVELDRELPPDLWCDALLDRLLAHGKGDDDVALLGMTYAPVLVRRLPAEPRQLAGLRRELRRWLTGIGASEDEVSDLLVAAGEACANAVEHAYRGGPGELLVELRLGVGRELTLTVTDGGQWRTVPAPGDRGRGLPLMRALMESVSVVVREAGTVVTLRRQLGAPA